MATFSWTLSRFVLGRYSTLLDLCPPLLGVFPIELEHTSSMVLKSMVRVIVWIFHLLKALSHLLRTEYHIVTALSHLLRAAPNFRTRSLDNRFYDHTILFTNIKKVVQSSAK